MKSSTFVATTRRGGLKGGAIKMSRLSKSTDIDSAVTNVTEGWFPINTDLLATIQSGIESGKYDQNFDALIRDLKSDASLYLLCLRKLIELVEEKHVGKDNTFTPPEVFRNAGLDELKAILSSDLKSEVRHKFENASEIQNSRVKETIIAASTTEALAKDSQIDPELGFSCAMLRQLGLTLIAWNYPHVYAKALEALTSTKINLDHEIQKIIGFTPTMLAVRISRRWKLNPTVRAAVGDKDARIQAKANEEDTLAATLEKLCQVGEALARASSPEIFPTAIDDWSFAETTIQSVLGSKGVEMIQRKVKEQLQHYAKKAPEAFSFKINDDQKDKIENSRFVKHLLDQNTYIKECPPLVKLQIKELYSTFSQTEISRESIQKLISDVIPSAGFDMGCIYMLDPNSMSLVPLLKIGEIPEDRTKSVRVSSINLDSNPVSTAFRCTTPIKQTEQFPTGQLDTISGALGSLQKAGVLYLEVSERLRNNHKIDATMVFKALRQCLNHCLNLK